MIRLLAVLVRLKVAAGDSKSYDELRRREMCARRPAPSFEANKSIRSSATRSAAMSLSSNRSYVTPRIRGGFSG